MKTRKVKNTIFTIIGVAIFSWLGSGGIAGATLYNYPEGDEYGLEGSILSFNPTAGIYGEAGLPGKEAEDLYGISILGFNLTPDDFGLLSWELTYTGPEGEKIGPTRRPHRWAFNPSGNQGGGYISLAKRSGGSTSGGGSGGGGGGGIDIGGFFDNPKDNPQNDAYSTPPGGNDANTNNPLPPQTLIPEPGTFVILATGLLGLGGTFFGARKIRRRQR